MKGYQAAIGQVGIGIASYWIGEFAPEITRVLRKKPSATGYGDIQRWIGLSNRRAEHICEEVTEQSTTNVEWAATLSETNRR